MDNRFVAALRDLVRCLEATGVDGMLIGGWAVSLAGHPRFTKDLDASVAGPGLETQALLALTREHGFLPRRPDAAEFAQRHYILLLEHAATGVPVDLSLAFTPFELEALSRAVRVTAAGIQTPIPTVDDLIVLKAVAGREKDWQDILELVELRGAELDCAHIRYWVSLYAEALERPELVSELDKLLPRR